MFACSSRTALRMPAKIASAPCGQCSFSTSSPSSVHKVLVEVLKPFGGRKLYDRVRVASAFARLELVPSRKARIIPHTRGIDRTRPRRPANYEELVTALNRDLIDGPEARQQSPSKARKELLRLDVPSGRKSPKTLSELQSRLDELPETLVFKMRTAGDSDILYGSITINDVISRVSTRHNLPASDIIVTWMERIDQAARMKSLDTWSALVMLREGDIPHKRVEVQAVRLKDGEKADVTAEKGE